MSETELWPASESIVYAGFLGSLLAGLGTGVGAVPIFFRRRWPRQSEVIMLAAAAGIMLGATVFSLIIPGLEVVSTRTDSPLRAALEVGAGLLLGAFVIWQIHAKVPHEHFVKGREGGPPCPWAVTGFSSLPSRCTAFPKA